VTTRRELPTVAPVARSLGAAGRARPTVSASVALALTAAGRRAARRCRRLPGRDRSAALGTTLRAAILATVALLPLALPHGAAAQTTPPERPTFDVTLYGWLQSLDGRVGAGPLTASVESSFSNTIDKADTVVPFMGRVEGRSGRFGLFLDAAYVSLGFDRVSVGPFAARADSTLLVIDFGGTAEVAAGGDGRWALDALAGGRVTSVRNEIGLIGGPSVDQRESWFEPFIGLRLRGRVAERWDYRPGGYRRLRRGIGLRLAGACDGRIPLLPPRRRRDRAGRVSRTVAGLRRWRVPLGHDRVRASARPDPALLTHEAERQRPRATNRGHYRRKGIPMFRDNAAAPLVLAAFLAVPGLALGQSSMGSREFQLAELNELSPALRQEVLARATGGNTPRGVLETMLLNGIQTRFPGSSIVATDMARGVGVIRTADGTLRALTFSKERGLEVLGEVTVNR
jgi:hypothetical protein